MSRSGHLALNVMILHRVLHTAVFTVWEALQTSKPVQEGGLLLVLQMRMLLNLFYKVWMLLAIWHL